MAENNNLILKPACVKCFKVLSAKSRFRIFEYLKKDDKRMTVNALVRLTGLKQPTVTFHLDQLAEAGLIKKIRKGKNVFCQVNKRCEACPIFA